MAARLNELGRILVGQTAAERRARFDNGCCPVHGQFMSQISGWEDEDTDAPFTHVGCNRSDCGIYAKAFSYDGPWELPKDLAGLLDDRLPDPEFINLDAAPRRRKKSLKRFRREVWNKTPGVCYYCGDALKEQTFCVDHLVPESKGGVTEISNLFPSCRSCNSSKGDRSVEEFRFLRRVSAFHSQSGVRFSARQLDYLESIGMRLDIPRHQFWYELRDA